MAPRGKCRYGASCTNSGCRFQHPNESTIVRAGGNGLGIFSNDGSNNLFQRDWAAQGQAGTVRVQASHKRKEGRRPAHVTAVLDLSGSMECAVDAVHTELQKMIQALKETDSITIFGFNEILVKIAHCKAGNVDIPRLLRRMKAAVKSRNASTSLYDGVVGALEDLQSHARGNNTVRFFMVFTDGEDNTSKSESAWSTRDKLAGCGISNFHPLFIAAGPQDPLMGMVADNARVISVGCTSASDIAQGFKEACRYIESTLKISIAHPDGTTTSSTFVAQGSTQAQVDSHMELAMHEFQKQFMRLAF